MTEAEWLVCTNLTPMLEFLRGPLSTSTKKVVFGKALTGYYHKRVSDRKSRLFACACCRRFWRLLDEEHCRHLIDYARSFGSLDGRGLTEPSLDSCHKAVELAEGLVDEVVSPDELDALSEAVSAFFHPASDYCACYGEEIGPFDRELVASGEAAQAVHHATSLKVNVVLGELTEAFDSLNAVVHWTTQAAGFYRCTGPGKPSEVSASEERAAQCVLLREIVGNPFRPVVVDPVWLTWQNGIVLSLAQAAYEDRRLPEGTLDNTRFAILADALEDAGCANEDILVHCRGPGPHVRGCYVLDLLLNKK
jgi:hypothetical protein